MGRMDLQKFTNVPDHRSSTGPGLSQKNFIHQVTLTCWFCLAFTTCTDAWLSTGPARLCTVHLFTVHRCQSLCALAGVHLWVECH